MQSIQVRLLQWGSNEMELFVKDILNLPHFEDAEVLVGKKGLNRIIKWVHVVEIDTFGHLLNGQEMILTTGIGWIDDKEKSIHYLQQLLDHHASVLCIELDKTNNQLPKEMLLLAEENSFPILIFNKEVKFVDITKDIHKVLLGYQENVWWNLEDLYQKMHQNLVSNGSIDHFLKMLHHGTQKQVALIHNNGQSWFFPSPSEKQQQKWILDIKEYNKYPSTPVSFLNEIIAQLYLLEEEKDSTLFDQFAMNRCGEFLTQYFWKFHQQIEVQKVKKNEWVIEAIFGKLSTEEIIDNIQQAGDKKIRVKEIVIGVLPDIDNLLPKKVNNNFLTGTMMSIRIVFENEGFHFFASKHKDHYVLLLINQQGNQRIFERLKKSLNAIRNMEPSIFISDNLQLLSFGKVINHINLLPTSYESALATLHYQQSIERLAEPFYQNLGPFRLFQHVKDRSELNDIINDFIGPLIKYDQEKGTELLKTLKIFLKNLGAKNQTAVDLFIVRQTLYHRLERIEKLIGSHFMEPKQRMMIEYAIYALEYLEKSRIDQI